MRRIARYLAAWAVAAAAASQLPVAGGAAHASDFWDAVRTPHLSAYRARVRAAERALDDNRPSDARASAERAIALIAELPAAHVMRGRALAAQGALDQALSSFEHARSLDATALDALAAGWAAASTALSLDKPRRAAEILTRVLANPLETTSRARALAMQADALQALGHEQLDTAILTYRNSLSAQDSARARLGLALALHRVSTQEGRPSLTDEALHLAQAAGEGTSPEAIASWSLPDGERAARAALVHEARGERQQALEHWQRAAGPTDPEHGRWRAHALQAATRLGGAAR